MERTTSRAQTPLYGLDSIAEQLQGQVITNDSAKILELNSKIGKGCVKFEKLQNGIEVFNLDVTLNEYTEIFIENLTQANLNFIYCYKGNCTYILHSIQQKIKLDQFQSTVTFQKNNLIRSIAVEGQNRLVLNIISVNQNSYFKKFQIVNNKDGDKLSQLLKGVVKNDNFVYSGGYSLKIAEQLKKLFNESTSLNISDKFSEKGRYYLILALQMEQFYEEINQEKNTNKLSKLEILKIVEMSDFIKSHPEASHDIKTLCRKTALSPAKLQEGFKFMFNKTVSDYVRIVRLEKATNLLINTDLTISEIVYTVGLTSRSYFCKIFKEKHKCSPKVYRKRMV